MAGEDEVIDHALVEISPDFSGFKREFDTKLKAALKDASVKVKVSGVTGLRPALTAAARQVNAAGGIKIKIGEVTGLQTALNRATRTATVKAKVEADTTALETRLAAISAKAVTIKVKFDVDRSNLPGGIGPGGPGGGGGRGPGGGGRRDLGDSLGSGFGRVLGFNSAQGKLLFPLIPLIAPATAGLLGLASAAATTGAAIGAFSVAAVGHIADITAEIKKMNELGLSVSDLPKGFEKLIPALDSLKQAWRGFLTDTRGPVFDVFVKGLQIGEQILGRLTPIVNGLAPAFRNSLGIVGQFFDTSAVRDFIAVVQRDAPGAIESLTRSVSYLAQGLLELFTGFAPAGADMVTTIESISKSFRDWAASFRNSTGFQDFIEYARVQGPRVLKFFVDLIALTGKLVVALAPLGQVLLFAVDSLATFLNLFPAEFFATLAAGFVTARLAAIAFSGAMLIAGRVGVVGLVGGMQGLIGALRLLPTYFLAAQIAGVEMFTVLTAAEIASGIGAIVALIGIIAAGVLVFNNSSDSLTKYGQEQQAAAQAAADHAAQVRALTDELVRNNGVLTETTKLETARKLQDSGILDGDTGIDVATAVKGFTGDATARMSVMETLRKQEQAAMDASWNYYLNAGEDWDEATALALKEKSEKATDRREYFEKNSVTPEELAKEKQLQDALGISADKFNDVTQSAKDYYQTLVALQNGDFGSMMEKLTLFETKSDIQQFAEEYQKRQGALRDANESVTDSVEALRDARDSEARTIEDVARANADAADAVVSAEQKIKDAYKDTAEANKDLKDAQLALTEARKEAARALRDQPLTEEAARIRLEQANLEVRRTATRDPADLIRRQALLGQQEARNNLTDILGEGTLLRKQGIEGQPGVVSAKEAVTSAKDKVTETVIARKKAQKDYTRALEDQTRVAKDGKESISDAREATDDARIATDKATESLGLVQTAWSNINTVLGDVMTSMSLTKGEQNSLKEQFAKGMSLNAGNIPEQLKTIQTFIQATKEMASDPSIAPSTAWFRARAAVNGSAPKTPGPAAGSRASVEAGGPTKLEIAHTNDPHKATGGPIFGGGTETSDSLPAWLSNNEHVWTAAEVHGVGGHGKVEALRAAAKRGMLKFATGGAINAGGLNSGDQLLKNGLLDYLSTGSAPTVASATDSSSNGLGATVAGAVTAVSKAFDKTYGAVAAHVQAAGEKLASMFGITNVGGKTNGSWGDHPTGHALDFMTNNLGKPTVANPIGTALANYAVANRGALGVKYVIWNHRITANNSDQWGPYSVPGQGPHTDHVHVSFNKGAGSGALVAGGDSFGAGAVTNPFAGVNFRAMKTSGLHQLFLDKATAGMPVGAGTGDLFNKGPGKASGDASVARTAWTAAKGLGASNKVLLALFEAGLVESGMRNLTRGDRDSLGFLQQRPSQGWGTAAQITDVAHATRSFVTRAMRREANYPTAGKLAQGVQVSAFPAKYDARRADAIALLQTIDPSYKPGNYSLGGPVRSKVYDDGGVLSPGRTVVDNRSGQPEAVFTSEQLADILGRKVDLSEDTIRLLREIFNITVILDGEKVGKKIDTRLGYPLGEY